MDKKHLFDMAVTAMHNSYAPYSNFNVGAALLCSNGKIVTGCNVENASYPATNCAERTAIFSAIAKGYKKFDAIMIVGGPNYIIKDFVMPCGICRQVFSEFCDDDFIIMTGINENNIKEYFLKDILPYSFNKNNLR